MWEYSRIGVLFWGPFLRDHVISRSAPDVWKLSHTTDVGLGAVARG